MGLKVIHSKVPSSGYIFTRRLCASEIHGWSKDSNPVILYFSQGTYEVREQRLEVGDRRLEVKDQKLELEAGGWRPEVGDQRLKD